MIITYSIKDVAQQAGVSPATVSRMMNNRGYVGAATRAKIQLAIDALGYHPNASARALSMQRSYVIGVIMPMINTPFFGELLQSIEQKCCASGYKLMLFTSPSELEQVEQYVEMLNSHRVDGIILCSRRYDSSRFADLGLPVVSVEHTVDARIPSVECDSVTGGALAAQALIDGGCRNIALLVRDPANVPETQARIYYFLRECEKNSINAINWKRDDAHMDECMRALFAAHPETDGIYPGSDYYASWAVRACRELGRRVPEDVQVVAFDNTLIAECAELTAVEQPIRAMGEYAFDMLLSAIDGKMVPSRTILPVKLVKRRSTRA